MGPCIVRLFQYMSNKMQRYTVYLIFGSPSYNRINIVKIDKNLCVCVCVSNNMHRYTVYLYLETALHVSGGTSTHYQERIQLYVQHCQTVTATWR